MKQWQIIKAILYLVLATFIFIFQGEIMPWVGILVGGIVCLYAAEDLIVLICKKLFFQDSNHLFDDLAQLFIAIILFLVSSDIIKVCLVWGVWSILRECKDMAEAIDKFSKNRLQIINVIESVTIIVLSFLMILEPNEEHAGFHVILLGIELVVVVMFCFLEIWSSKRLKSEKDETIEKEISI